MHMALRRMAAWIQEMEKEGEEADFGSQLHSAAKSLFSTKDRHLVVFSWDHEKAGKAHFANSKGGEICAVSVSFIGENTTQNFPLVSMNCRQGVMLKECRHQSR